MLREAEGHKTRDCEVHCVWKSMMRRDALYAQEMAGYVAYWERLYSEMTGPLPRTEDVSVKVSGLSPIGGGIMIPDRRHRGLAQR